MQTRTYNERIYCRNSMRAHEIPEVRPYALHNKSLQTQFPVTLFVLMIINTTHYINKTSVLVIVLLNNLVRCFLTFFVCFRMLVLSRRICHGEFSPGKLTLQVCEFDFAWFYMKISVLGYKTAGRVLFGASLETVFILL